MVLSGVGGSVPSRGKSRGKDLKAQVELANLRTELCYVCTGSHPGCRWTPEYKTPHHCMPPVLCSGVLTQALPCLGISTSLSPTPTHYEGPCLGFLL